MTAFVGSRHVTTGATSMVCILAVLCPVHKHSMALLANDMAVNSFHEKISIIIISHVVVSLFFPIYISQIIFMPTTRNSPTYVWWKWFHSVFQFQSYLHFLRPHLKYSLMQYISVHTYNKGIWHELFFPFFEKALKMLFKNSRFII